MKNRAEAATTERDARWKAVVARDASADGQFYYSVRTTGVYCRPSCASRLAKPENVRFHATPADAEAAGFRACRRCQPNRPNRAQQHAETIAKICRFIAASEEIPRLETLARRAHMSAAHFQRAFKAATGVTPAAFARAHRANRVRDELLRPDATITNAIYESGFNSGGRFYAHADAVLGMTPTQYRAGGANAEIRFAVGECALGAILVAQSERGLCAIALGDDAETLVRELQTQFPRAQLVGDDRDFQNVVAQVVAFVEAPERGLNLPLDVRGTAFQLRVWQALQKIPSGRTASYAEIAQQIGAPKSVRAVAGACAANTLAVAIPCHRIVRTDGELSGYRWGIERKQALLKAESAR